MTENNPPLSGEATDSNRDPETTEKKILSGVLASDKIQAGRVEGVKNNDKGFVNACIGHFSMQFSDNRQQKLKDANKVFKRGYHWITGTEAAEQDTRQALAIAASNHGYKLHFYLANWVAVKREIIKPGTYKTGFENVVSARQIVGRGNDRGIAIAQFRWEGVGSISVLGSHYATKGSPVRRNQPNLRVNRTLAQAIGDKAEKLGNGKRLLFYGGDQNINDDLADTFFGEPLVSIQDELVRYPNTGHGPIDVIARFRGDSRVEAKRLEVYRDKDIFLHTDHYLLEAVYRIRKL